MKIFKLNDCDWWAGEDLESVKSAYIEEVGGDVDDDARELTEAEMDSLDFVDELPDYGEHRTFREQLRRMIDSGAQFPCFFASTEY
jgi:hypothetical protein